MLRSGRVMQFPRIDRPKVDKHSTGGIGDKVSIPLAPARGGVRPRGAMISGSRARPHRRHARQTRIDPGLRTNLKRAGIRALLERTGVALGRQTEDLVPATASSNALRDVTGWIESIPLIASSIMSKKLAEGLDALVLDIKFGSGASSSKRERGALLAQAYARLARKNERARDPRSRRACRGRSGACRPRARDATSASTGLEGGGPSDLRELTCVLGGEMLRLGGWAKSHEEGQARIARSHRRGSARAAVRSRVIPEQGGDPVASTSAHVCAVDAAHRRRRRPDGHSPGATFARSASRSANSAGAANSSATRSIRPSGSLSADEGALVHRGDVVIEVHHNVADSPRRARCSNASSRSVRSTRSIARGSHA